MLRRLPWMIAGAALTVIAGWGLWFALAWLGYGKTPALASDEVLDRLMPTYEVAERHEITALAPASATFEAAKAIDLERAPVVHAIFASRRLLLADSDTATARLTLGELEAMGWARLVEVPGREVVFGAVTQPWRGDVRFRPLPPDVFATFDSAGYVKIVWTLAVDSVGPARSRFRTETRVLTTDATSRAKFRRYWAWLSPGIVLIRWQAVRLVRADAERRARGAP